MTTSRVITFLSSPGGHRGSEHRPAARLGRPLILKAVSLGQLHGYGILLRIEQISRGWFRIEQGALYPALCRLVHWGLLESGWGVSENNRRARSTGSPPSAATGLRTETTDCRKLVAAMAAALDAQPEGS